MKYFVRIAAIFVATASAWSDSAPGRVFTDEQWREDITEYVELVKSTHIAMYHSVSEEDFQRAVSALLEAVPEMSDSEIGMELVAIAALIGDGHTWLSMGEKFSSAHLPVFFYEFEDGLFVTGALPGFEQHIGKQVVSIAGMSPDAVLVKAERYTSRDNAWGLLNARARWLGSRIFYIAADITEGGNAVAYRLRGSEGNEEEVTFAFMPRAAFQEAAEKIPSTPDSDLPLYRQRGDENYWMEYLRKGKTVYVKFNAVQNLEDGPRIGVFTNEMLDLVEEKKAKRLVIDVRHNSGGDGNLTTRMIRKISENERINQPGHLFVITGRRTFSAALMFTARMERGTEALFVGEPGRGKPNSYSEYNGITLTHTGMSGSVSSIFHQEGEPDDTREYIPVDISAPLTSADFFAGNDPVLEAILTYK